MSTKIVTLDNVTKDLAETGGKKVLVGGCFDILHIGHLRFLKSAAAQGKTLIVALESDEFIKKTKKRKPFHSQAHRAEVLAALEMVDWVILLPLMQNYADYFDLVKKVRPQVIAITAGDSQMMNKKKQAKAVSANLIEVTAIIDGKSTSHILKMFES